MDAYRIHIKYYLEPEAGIELDRLIPIFHRWIQHHELDELLLDVADYKHVPDGPGVMLVAHEAYYSVDSTGGRTGLLYARRRPAAVPFEELLRSSFGKALRFMKG